jgi:hypothetical protein
MRVRRLGAAAAAAALVAAVALPAGASTRLESRLDLGLFDPATAEWHLRDAAGNATSFRFGRPGDVPLVGDWDGDGIDTPAVYDPDTGWLSVRNSIGTGATSAVAQRDGLLLPSVDGFEWPLPALYPLPAGAEPVVADPDGDGRDAVSVAVGDRLHVLYALPSSRMLSLDGGMPLPTRTIDLIAGDFDGDGADEFAAQTVAGRIVGVGEAALYVDLEAGFGPAVSGDWDGNGIATPGIYETLTASLSLFHGMNGAVAHTEVAFGATGLVPLLGSFGRIEGADPAPERIVGLPALEEGDSGRAVEVLQDELRRRGLYRGTVDGVYGEATSYAVMAFHKALDLEPQYDWDRGDTLRLINFSGPLLPDRPGEPDRVEVDLGRQLLFVFEDHEVTAIVPVSTGGSYVYYSPRNDAVVRAETPRGDFELFHFARGWHCDPLTGWCIYNPWSFTPAYAVHGYNSVPEYPASHGCVRLTTWDSDELSDNYLFVGIPIHIWDIYEPDASTPLG